MCKLPWALGLTVQLAVCPANSSIIALNADDDDDGAFICETIWDSATSTLSITASQYWAPGHVVGSVTTDTELDPTLWVINSVKNNTASVWTGYDLSVSMNKPFSIVGVVAPPDWTWAITPPASNSTDWTGSIEFTAGTPIGINASGTFGWVVHFAGSVDFLQETIPTPIPEPVSLATLTLAAMVLLGRHLCRRA